LVTISRLLQIVGLFCKRALQRDDILQKRPMILRSLLIAATPSVCKHRETDRDRERDMIYIRRVCNVFSVWKSKLFFFCFSQKAIYNLHLHMRCRICNITLLDLWRECCAICICVPKAQKERGRKRERERCSPRIVST